MGFGTSYPRIVGGSRQLPPEKTRCDNCGFDATSPIWIEHSDRRAEDVRLWVCTPCVGRASRNLRGFLRSCEKRAKHMGEPNAGS